MRKTHTTVVILLGALCCAFSTACSSGGGGRISVDGPGNTAPAVPANTAPAMPVNTAPAPDPTDTGIAGTVAAPAAAFGSAPPQFASSGGPSFNCCSGPNPSNVTFPLIIGSLQQTPAGLSSTPDTGATLTVINYSCGPCQTTQRLVIPSLGINQAFSENAAYEGGNSSYFYGLDYAVMGTWKRAASVLNPNAFSDSEFVFGYETPQAAMPTSGTAVFSTGSAQANVYKTIGTEIHTTNVGTNSVSITANFGSGAINGTLQFGGVGMTYHLTPISRREATGSAAPLRPHRRQAHS